MHQLLVEFERDCAKADVSPTAALIAGGLHRSVWARWKAGEVSPTLKSVEQAREGLARKKAEKGEPQGAAA